MILNRQRSVRVARRPLESFLRAVRRELKLERADLTICFVTKAEIACMNETFRGKKGPTDVLSFPNAAPLEPRSRARVNQHRHPHRSRKSYGANEERGYLGDVAIAPLIAKRNAKKYGRTLLSELEVLILHGVLHLLGYDHETDRGEMNRIEGRLRERFGLA